jgi:hypothetical protein
MFDWLAMLVMALLRIYGEDNKGVRKGAEGEVVAMAMVLLEML